MKNKIITVMICLILPAVISSIGPAAAQGLTASNAVPVGMTVTTRVECGTQAGSMEPYEAKIAVQQVVRGNEAWERIKAANASNQPPAAGYDYVLARVKFEMKALLIPGNKTFELARPKQFVALSADGNELDPPSVVPPEPRLHRTVRAGEVAEGWIALLVERADRKPVMFFDPAAGGAMGGGKVLFFQLY